MSDNLPIPEAVLARYIERYPFLRHLAGWVRAGNPRAARRFAQTACRLSVPPGVSPADVYQLAGVAGFPRWDASANEADIVNFKAALEARR
jgi:hypothetical protein